jgi:cytoskeletal protein RodZ
MLHKAPICTIVVLNYKELTGMWPFNRRKKVVEQQIPEEINEYYQAERRERTGVAWLLALGTLIVTLILAVGLFFGGRWVYRKVVKNDKPKQTSGIVSESPATTSPSDSSTSSGSNNQSTSNSPSSSSAAPTTPGSSTGTSTPNSSTTTPTTTANNSGTTQGAATTGSQNASLPNTGPSNNLVGIFVVTAVAGAIAHRMVWSRRNS